MNQRIGEKGQGKTRILVAPLDWGLGHATRCIPVIRELLAQGVNIWLAGEGAQEQLLRAEFPQLSFLNLPGYRVRYSKTGAGLLWKLLIQGPRIRRAIRFEHEWLKKAVQEHGFDAVISDNRYGLYHSSITCVFMTHQLTIKSPVGAWTEKIIQRKNYSYINRFTECWIPDREGENNLAGELSHPNKKPGPPLRYIGLLSRFEKKEKKEITNHLLVILSGPEPQRTLLENKIIEDISHFNGTAVIVRGLPGENSLIPSTGMIKFYNHLPAAELNEEMLRATLVISRSGYSTVMDIVAMGKKNILIPTPGQTEQEYLAAYLLKKHIACIVLQKDFVLEEALQKSAQFNYQLPSSIVNTSLKQAIAALISTKK